ncbi:hypothetical protein ACH4LE_34275 [Streptomyces sp. NPDC017413]|uniref:hypothetical protein n=1 Tax=Streptomyces sp. NPDC017413 TaxID=3364994 RepID=UPI0037A16F8D
MGCTDYEADVDSSGDFRSRDGLSTRDAGNLGATEIALACTWSHPYEGKKNDLREADVRYNTSDYDSRRCSGWRTPRGRRKRDALVRFPPARTRLDFEQAMVAIAADGTFTARILTRPAATVRA